MKKLLTALVLVLAAAAVWFALSGDDRQTSERPAGPGPSPTAKVSAPADPAQPLELAADPVAGDASTRAVASVDTTKRFGDWEEGEELWIEGRVIFPSGAPADDTLRVVALNKDLTPRELYGTFGVFQRLDHADVAKSLVAVEKVGADGRFRIPFPKSATTGWLALEGRFLYMNAAEKVDLSQGSTALAPALGGVVYGKVTVPAGSDASTVLGEEHAELGRDRTAISVSADMANGWTFSRSIEIDEDGGFEFRAVRAGETHELSIDPDDFAKFVEQGVELAPGEERLIDVALLLGGTVRGRVVDEAHEPVEDADVAAIDGFVFGFPTGTSARTKSGPGGTFELKGIAAGDTKLIASIDGYVASDLLDFDIAEGSVHDGIELVLGSGAAIAGTVRYPDGTPAAEAIVRVEFDPEAMLGPAAMNATRGARSRATTDENGRFHASGLGKGPFEVTAYALSQDDSDEPRWSARKRPVAPDTEGLELLVQRPTAIRGRVVERDGTPVTAFTIEATQKGAAASMRVARGGSDEGLAEGEEWPAEKLERHFEDEDGRFVLPAIASGPWRLEARAEHYAPSAPYELTLPLEASDVTIELHPAATVIGTVVDPNGEPVAGAKVTLMVQGERSMAQLTGELKLPETTSEADGAFELNGLGSGSQALVASHPDFAQGEPFNVELTPGATVTDVALTLRNGGRITGMVYAADGEPLAGGQIIAQQPATFSSHMRRTAADGTFEIDRVAPGDWTVTAILNEGALNGGADGEPADFLENIKFAMVHVEDREETHVILGAPPADPVRVHGVVKHDKRPLASGILSFVLDGAKGFDAMKIASIKSDGTYSVELNEPGRYMVSAQIIGETTFQQQTIEFTREIPKADDHTLDLELPLGRISGRVTGSDGEALVGVRVTLMIEGGMSTRTMMGGQYAEVTTADDGYYDFNFLRPASYTVAAGGATFGGAFGMTSSNGRQIHDGVRLTGGDHQSGIDFRLSEAGDIAGVVLDPAGKPVAGAAIFVRDEGGRLLERFSMIESDPSGKFEYAGVAEGEYTVIARSGELASAETHRVRVSPGRTASTKISMDPGTMLLVTVIDSQGDDVEASVSVLDEDGREMAGMLGYTQMMARMTEGFKSDQQRIGPLPAGSYTVLVSAEDGRTAKKSTTLDGRDERKLKIRLR